MSLLKEHDATLA